MLRNILSVFQEQFEQERAEQELKEKKFGKKISDTLTFKYIEFDDKYRKKWNVHSSDFGHLYKNGKKISDTPYRIGGFGHSMTDGYFMLIKHIEAYYDDNITKVKADKPHLESQFCILDKNGIEKVNFKQFASPYLIGGQVYSLDGNYYNIETGELYCNSSVSIKTKDFIFLYNRFDKDKSKRGVMRISKLDGTFKLYKE
jgi:hypothetical protein